jgi:hypothetical protein
MIVRVGEFKIYLCFNKFLPNRILVESDDGRLQVTVGMLKSFLEYMLSLESIKNPKLEKYKKAKKLFEACTLILRNNQPKKLSKDYFKAAADVLEEVENMKAKTDEEKVCNAQRCLAVKLLIDSIDYAHNNL